MKEEKNFALTHFAQALKQRRRELGLTQEQLAEKANLAWGYLGEIERGKKNPSILTAVALAKALEIPLDYFVEEAISLDQSSSHEYFVREKPDEYLAKTSQKKESGDEDLLNFYHALSKAMTLVALIQDEALRNSIISQLTIFGLHYFKAYETNSLNEMTIEVKRVAESIQTALAILMDRKLAQRISTCLHQISLLPSSVDSEKSEF